VRIQNDASFSIVDSILACVIELQPIGHTGFLYIYFTNYTGRRDPAHSMQTFDAKLAIYFMFRDDERLKF
jgi:hypothetical protein